MEVNPNFLKGEVNMQEVISVVYCKNGILDHIRSFIINDSMDEIDRWNIIEICEQCFCDYIKKEVPNVYSQDDLDVFLSDGFFSNNGVDIYISWSL